MLGTADFFIGAANVACIGNKFTFISLDFPWGPLRCFSSRILRVRERNNSLLIEFSVQGVKAAGMSLCLLLLLLYSFFLIILRKGGLHDLYSWFSIVKGKVLIMLN